MNPSDSNSPQIQPTEHLHIQSLLAPYALHALDEHEYQQLDSHLAWCTSCQAEVADLLDTAGVLGLSAVEPAPTSVWDKISAATVRTVTATSEPWAEVEPAPVASLDQHRQSRSEGAARSRRARRPQFVWLATGAAAAALLMVPFVAQSRRTSTPTIAQVAAQQAARPGSRTIELVEPNTTKRLGDVVVSSDGTGFVRLDVEELPADKTYQLWTVVNGTAVSAGIIGRHPTVAPFPVAPGAVAVAVSIEPAGGSLQAVDGPIGVASLA